MMCGGTGDLLDATSEIQQLVDEVKGDLESKEGKKFSKFVAVKYKSQVVAGTNYFIKVQVSDSEYAHLRVFKPLPHTGASPELSDYRMGKTLEDAVDYF